MWEKPKLRRRHTKQKIKNVRKPVKPMKNSLL